MRSRVWGLQLSFLFLVALLPAVAWFIFRWQDQITLTWVSFVRYYRPELLWGGMFYAVFSATWIYFMRRGIFEARVAPYAIIATQVFYELIQAVSTRNFSRIGGAMLLMGLGMVIYRWLEQKVNSAALNPGIHWYEGNRKAWPHAQVTVSVNETEYTAKILRLDRKGLFLMLAEGASLPAASLKKGKSVPLAIRFRDRSLNGQGVLQSLLRTPNPSLGIGLQFLAKDLYHLNEYTALVEQGRAEGLCSGEIG
jgi:hypothetical protein